MNDRLTLLQNEGESYEKHDETPTVSFVSANECLTLLFRIILQGERLHALWRDLQLYRVRQIHESDDHETETRHPTVRRIEIIKLDDPANDDAE